MRISEKLSEYLINSGIIGTAHGRATTNDNIEYPIIINTKDRTLDGLMGWLHNLNEEDVHSFQIEVGSVNPLYLAISPSDRDTDISAKPITIKKPEKGLYLGNYLLDQFNELIPTNDAFTIDDKELLTHAFICGVTGAGKTVLGKIILEEAAIKGIPSIAIDLKGDISSLAIMLTGDDPEDFVQWITPVGEKSVEELAAQMCEQHRTNLEKWGFCSEDVSELERKVAVNIFTPRSNDGFRLALSAFPEVVEDIDLIRKDDQDSYDSLLDFLSEQFVARLSVTKNLAEKAEGYFFEILKTCYENGIKIRGYEGIKRILDEVRVPELNIDQIGGLPTDEYISLKDRVNLATSINALLTGANRNIFEGWPVNIEKLVDKSFHGGKTPLSIINISHLASKDQLYIVGYIAYMICFWMKRLSGTYSPRLLFYIDEIGGGGGKEAFFPSVAKSPSKPALNYLLRQGRAQGVCCIFATQNPGDIDYKGLSNCNIWMVGQLKTQRDRNKIEQGASNAELEFESAKRHIAGLSKGKFYCMQSEHNPNFLQERWLLSIHKPLSSQELKRIKSRYEDEAKLGISSAIDLINKRRLNESLKLLKEVIARYPFASLINTAFISVVKVLISLGRIEEAKKEIITLLERFIQDEERAESHFLLGTCFEKQEEFAEAKKSYVQVLQYTRAEDLREKTLRHIEYSEARAEWPGLREYKKIAFWLSGRKPTEKILEQLIIEDEKILTEKIFTKLQNINFDLPQPIDYDLLKEFEEVERSKADEAKLETIKAEKWAKEQSIKISELLNRKQFIQSEEAINRVIQRIKLEGARIPDQVLKVISEFNNQVTGKEESINREFRQLKARQFEFEIARLLMLNGYKVNVTALTGDDGVDVFAKLENEKIVVQCKRWSSDKPIGRSVVDELAGTAKRHNATRAILATTSFFSEDALKVALVHNIELWDFREICKRFRKVGKEPAL